jgi:hypothetical protein
MKKFLLAVAVGLVLLTVSFYLQFELPDPTGPYAVGRTVMGWTDTARLEEATDNPDDWREVIVQVWYPAIAGSGDVTGYFLNLDLISSALIESGEVSALEVWGLRFMRSHSRADAELSNSQSTYPLVLFSPGNGTNMEFYAALAEDLASHGHIVAGINHPYDVAAVQLEDSGVAVFAEIPFMDLESHQAAVARRIDVRAADARFVLDRLAELNTQPGSPFAGRLDLERVAVVGHSLGGITAAEVCRTDARVQSCANLDGLQAGGPFSARPDPQLPNQPFLFITKEENLHPNVLEMLDRSPGGATLIQVSGAKHNSFTDGPLLQPGLLPIPGRAERVTAQVRLELLKFLEQTL